MRNLLLLLTITVFASCGTYMHVGYDYEVTSAEYCYEWRNGDQGRGYYDCDGTYLGRKVYNPYETRNNNVNVNYIPANNWGWNPWFAPTWGWGPRVVVYPSGGGGNSTSNVATPRGSSGSNVTTTPNVVQTPRGGNSGNVNEQ